MVGKRVAADPSVYLFSDGISMLGFLHMWAVTGVQAHIFVQEDRTLLGNGVKSEGRMHGGASLVVVIHRLRDACHWADVVVDWVHSKRPLSLLFWSGDNPNPEQAAAIPDPEDGKARRIAFGSVEKLLVI